jgi:hypothetical protein
MGLFIAGRASGFIALVIVFVSMLIGVARAKQRLPNFRKIAGLEAIEEAVGRATEMGKPVFYTPGFGDVSGTTAAPSLAGLDLLGYVGKLTARYDTRLEVSVGHPNSYTLAQEVLRNAYLSEGRPDSYNDEIIRFTSEIQFAYTAATLGMIQRGKPATCFFTGYFAAEAIILSEAAAAIGAMAIAGATNHFQIPFFAAACDYTMIGEEFLAAGAFISKDPNRIGGVAGQDYVKAIAALVLLVGALLVTMGNKSLADLLKL